MQVKDLERGRGKRGGNKDTEDETGGGVKSVGSRLIPRCITASRYGGVMQMNETGRVKEEGQ